MFTAALVKIAQMAMNTMEYLAMKRKEELTHHMTWMNVENIMLSKRNQSQRFYSYKMSSKSIETESRLMAVWGQILEWRNKGVIAMVKANGVYF